MISEEDLRAMREADREIGRELARKRKLTDAQRKQKSKANRAWLKRNPDKARRYAQNYWERHRESIKQARRKQYREASAKAVPNDVLIAWRKNRGIRQNEAAKLLGVCQASLSKWERGIQSTPAWVMARIQGDHRKEPKP